MKTLEEVKQDIRNIKLAENDDISDMSSEIIIAFGDYEFKGETQVIIGGDDVTWECYVNHEDAPIIYVEIEDLEVINVW